MKKLRLQMIIGALILLVTGMRAASNITLSTGDTVYDLIQNKSYLISGIDVNASNIDKDFFFYDLDGSGSVFKGEGNPTGNEEGEQIGGIGWGGSNDDDDEADAREMHFSLWDD